MEQTLISYFAAEKTEALVFIFIGNAALITSVLLLKFMPTLRGMIAPLALIAVIQLVVGGTVATRTEEQVAALRSQLTSAPAEFKAAEAARMQRVMDNFGLYKQIEVALLAAFAAFWVLQTAEFWRETVPEDLTCTLRDLFSTGP